MRTTKRIRSVATSLLLLLTTAALAGGGGGGGGGGSGGGGTSYYVEDLRRGSGADGYYQVYRCSEVRPGVYTDAFAEATTDSWPSKSRYLLHNARLYIDGRLRDRSEDIEREEPNYSESNYFTSLRPAVAEYEISCPRAILAEFEAKTYHKGIGIYGEREDFYDEYLYYGQ